MNHSDLNRYHGRIDKPAPRMKQKHNPVFLIASVRAQLELLEKQLTESRMIDANLTAKRLQGLAYSLYNVTYRP